MSDSTSTKSNQLLDLATGMFVILVFVMVGLAIFHPPEDRFANDRANGGEW